ncbi:MAG: tRNA pseudouridine(38-40) synthase TruA, partial [Rhizobiaceae bacterium]|nr:tRNA pseudouridine(38-40) synthase TruA [Rhizobiaceae bacterium]
LVGGNHQGQRPCVSRQQAEHKTASDNASITKQDLQKGSHPHKRPWKPFRLMEALNAHLREAGETIAIIDCDGCSDEFHARFSATGRRYVYRIMSRRAPLTVERGRAWNVKVSLDVEAMHQAAQLLIGEHDFTTFRSTECQAKSPVKTLDTLDVSVRKTHGVEVIEINTTARSYLHNQVRSLAGCLKAVGEGRWTEDDLTTALEARDRAACAPVAPAHGLYLVSVRY